MDIIHVDKHIEPKSFEQAMSSLCKEWNHTIKEEFDSLKDHSIWKFLFL